MKTQKPKKTPLSALGPPVLDKPEKRKRRRDRDGYFLEIAARAKKVIALYEKLNPGAEQHELVWFLLLDLMSLCDEESTLGTVDDAYAYAGSIYEDLQVQLA